MRRLVAIVACLVFLPVAARAVVIAGGTGSEQTTDPGGGFPFGNVGRVNSASAVYLGAFDGDYWVLTASHVVSSGASLGNFLLGGQTYTFVSGSGVVVTNGNGSATDLTLFRIASAPSVSNLSLAASAPTAGATVWMAGYGQRETSSALLHWSVAGSGNSTTWTAQPSAAGADAHGYAIANGGTERYGGTKIIDPTSVGATSDYDVGTGHTQALVTEFQAIGGYAQAATGDSGGALFYFDSGLNSWELAGVLGAVGTFDNQPAGTSIFGQVTYAADIAFYEAAIMAIVQPSGATPVPEPSASVLAFALAAGGAMIFRRRRTHG